MSDIVTDGRKYTANSRNVKYAVDEKLRSEGFVRVPVLITPKKVGTPSFNVALAYVHQSNSSAITLRYTDDDYGDRGDDYNNTEVEVTFLRMNQEKASKLRSIIESEIGKKKGPDAHDISELMAIQ